MADRSWPGRDQRHAARPGGSVRGLAATLVAAARTRIELATIEIEEEIARLSTLLAYAVAAGVLLFFAVVLVVLFVLAAFWDSHRLLALGLLAALFIVAGVAASLAFRKRSREKPRLFGASHDEWAKDYEELIRP